MQQYLSSLGLDEHAFDSEFTGGASATLSASHSGTTTLRQASGSKEAAQHTTVQRTDFMKALCAPSSHKFGAGPSAAAVGAAAGAGGNFGNSGTAAGVLTPQLSFHGLLGGPSGSPSGTVASGNGPLRREGSLVRPRFAADESAPAAGGRPHSRHEGRPSTSATSGGVPATMAQVEAELRVVLQATKLPLPTHSELRREVERDEASQIDVSLPPIAGADAGGSFAAAQRRQRKRQLMLQQTQSLLRAQRAATQQATGGMGASRGASRASPSPNSGMTTLATSPAAKTRIAVSQKMAGWNVV
jgi:hypothetical protein